ncbi:MAG TPA: hypothetical protein VF329_14810 [Gammaproteobacteria bacterium]
MTVWEVSMRGLQLLLVPVIGALSACSTSEVLVAHAVDLVPARHTIPEEELLDVGVAVFDPGVPEGRISKDVLEELLEEGTFVNIRRTEAVHMAVQLRDTLQRSGHWGSVWVTPKPSTAADLNVTARILQSDGDVVQVEVKAVDAAGRVWIDRPYELETASGVYNRQRFPNLDPYQDLFNSIANDLAAARARLGDGTAREIRTISALRYAADLVPGQFGRYVASSDDGTYELRRLPAVGDPMFVRTQQARQRERFFLETLNGHYDGFAQQVTPSYDGWREYAREEAIAVRESLRGARWRKALGLTMMAMSIASIMNGGGDMNSFSHRAVRDGLMMMSTGMLDMSAMRLQESRIHAEALEELSSSFDDDVAPMVVAIGGVVHRLTGTAEAQYAEWRTLLRRLFRSEAGFGPEDVEIYTEAETPVEPEDPAPALPGADGAAVPWAEPTAEAEAQPVATPARH